MLKQKGAKQKNTKHYIILSVSKKAKKSIIHYSFLALIAKAFTIPLKYIVQTMHYSLRNIIVKKSVINMYPCD